MDYELFTSRWLERAEREEGQARIDKSDKFICLWIAFNGWMKKEYGESTYDRNLIDKTAENEDMRELFRELKENNRSFSSSLKLLSQYTVMDMRWPEDRSKWKSYDGSFHSLLDVLYQIRCNLFHGRKNEKENEKDRELVNLAFDILHPLFREYWEKRRFSS